MLYIFKYQSVTNKSVNTNYSYDLSLSAFYLHIYRKKDIVIISTGKTALGKTSQVEI